MNLPELEAWGRVDPDTAAHEAAGKGCDAVELRAAIGFVSRWFLALLVAAVLVGAAAYFLAATRAPTYTADAVVAVGNVLSSPSPSESDVRTSAQLAQTYQAVATMPSVLGQVIQTTGLHLTVPELQAAVTADIVEGTSLLQLGVSLPSPAQAARVANAWAQQLIAVSPASMLSSGQSQGALPPNLTNALRVVNPATAPTRRSGISDVTLGILGAVLGIVLMAFVGMIREASVDADRVRYRAGG